MSHSGLILNRFSKLQNVIGILNFALRKIHRPLSRVRQRVRHSPRQDNVFFLKPCYQGIIKFAVF